MTKMNFMIMKRRTYYDFALSDYLYLMEDYELEKYLLEYTLFLADIEKFDINLIFEKSKKNSRIRGPLILYLALFFEKSELKDIFYKYPCIMIECDKVKNAYYLNKPMKKSI